MPKIKVILVERQRLLREALAYLLSLDEQFEVVVASGDPRQVISVCEQHPDAVILVSTHMEPLDGFRFCEIVRTVSPDANILGISGSSLPILVRRFIKTGGKGYITRNASRIELLEAIHAVHRGELFICDEVKTKMAKDDILVGDKTGWGSLTKMELLVVESIKKGMTSKDAAAQLGVTTKTIEAHRYRIFKKLNLNSAAAVLAFVYQEGI